MLPFNIGPGELLLLLILALIIVGPGKLPDVGAAIGKSLREFRRAATDVNEATSIPAPPSAAASNAAPGPQSAQPTAPDASPIGSGPAQNGTAPDSSRS